MPFMAIWKNEPRSLNGMKNSDAKSIIIIAPARFTAPFMNSLKTNIMPTAAPPYAIISITLVELSCIVRTFIVILRKCSLSLSISAAAFSSAL